MDRVALERGILGGALAAPDSLYELEEILIPDCFSGGRRVVWEGILGLHRRSEPVDLLTVTQEVERVTRAPGVAAALASLTEDAISLSFVRGHARRLRSMVMLDELRTALADVDELIVDVRPEPEEVEGILDEAMSRMFTLAAQAEPERRTKTLGDELAAAFARFERARDRSLVGLSTGFYKLDNTLGGLKPGQMLIVAARPSMGKSAFATTLATNVASSTRHESGHPGRVLIFSLEMSVQQLVTRLIAAESGIDSMKLMRGRFDQNDAVQARSACDRVAKLPLEIDDGPDQTVHRIRGRARRRMSQGGVDLIVIDYVQLMHAGKRTESRQVEIATISRGLKMLAKELKIPIVVLAQLSRAVESRDDKRPKLSDLRESGALEQDADVVMFLYREYIYKDTASPNAAELLVAKNREGPLDKIPLFFKPELTRFENLEGGLDG